MVGIMGNIASGAAIVVVLSGSSWQWTVRISVGALVSLGIWSIGELIHAKVETIYLTDYSISTCSYSYLSCLLVNYADM